MTTNENSKIQSNFNGSNMGPLKLVRDMSNSSHLGFVMAPGLEPNREIIERLFFDFSTQ